MWMRLAKFSLCNRLGVSQLADLLSIRDRGAARPGTSSGNAVDLRRMGRWNQTALTSILEISISDVDTAFCSVVPSQLLVRSSAELRYCAPCLAMGFHAAWFQWLHIERCPLHNVQLRNGCVHCSSPIPYSLGIAIASSPLRCTVCKHDWVPCLARPGGRCAPISSAAGQLMQRWSDYVRHVVSIDQLLCRDRGTGQYVTSHSRVPTTSATRPHVLTMMNRLFDSPPPIPAPQMAPCTCLKRPPSQDHSNDGTDSPDRDTRFNRQHWPHFASDFIHYEHAVLATRDHFFAPDRRELTDGQQQRLLLDGLVAPTSSMDRGAATAVGWAVSWLGPARALAPPTGFSAPAAGLTGWLAKLPLRERQTSLRAWRDQVERWLLEDLSHSACLWAEVVDFMSTKGHYLLYGEVVSPLPLATRHKA